jgi:hypothetical protein
MKKYLLSITAIAFVSALSAQITINESDLAPVYSVIHQNNDTTPTVVQGSAGTNQTYNLSAMAAQTTDTLLFTLPQFTPYGSTFAGSNLTVDVNSETAFLYFNESQTSFQITGEVINPIDTTFIKIPFDNFETRLNFPCTYNSSFVDTAHGQAYAYMGYDPGVGFQIDSIQVHTTIYKNAIVDGWGTAVTPLGTYNVIRVNTFRHEIDTVDLQTSGFWLYGAYGMDDSSRVYSYWANGIGYPVAELTDAHDFGTITGASWIPQLPQQIGMSEFTNTIDMNVFPNPSIETVTFTTKDANVKTICILDASGSVVRKTNVENNNTVVNVNDLSTGMYFYQAIDANGTILGKGKINITH